MNNDNNEAQELANNELAEVKGGTAEIQQLKLASGILERLEVLDLSGLRALEVDQLRVGNGFFAFRFSEV
ncbi:MAG: hypothetical protein ABI895_34800 [Deltaproteobacteria bacterium]